MPPLPSGSAFVVVGEFHNAGAPGPANWVWMGKHTYRLGTSSAYHVGIAEGTIKTSPAPYTPHDAYYIDSKIDDGKAPTGRVTAGLNYNFDLPLFMLPSEDYFAGGVCLGPDPTYYGLTMDTCDYDFTLKDKLVGLFVQASF